MELTDKKKLKRLGVEVTPVTHQMIEDLKKDLDLTSTSEVIRVALRLLKFFSDERSKGNRMGVIVDKTGEARPIELVR